MLAKILDFLPAIAFFVTYRATQDLIMATGVIIACSLLSFAIQYTLWRKTSRIQIFLTIAVLAFGLPTIFFDNPEIIKWKVTVVNLVLAGLLGFCQFVLKRNPLGYMLGQELPLPDFIWLKFGTCFIFYFIFAAGLNVIIAFYLPALFGIDAKAAESLWVDYKTFGNAILNAVFAVGCMAYMYSRYPQLRQALVELENKKKGNVTTQDKE